MCLEILKRYKEKYGFKLFAFSLLPSQINLLVELREGSTISMVMHDINSSYTKYYNGRYVRKGHLFRERFKSVMAEKEPYLLNLVRHIHNRPIRLGLAKDLAEYVYTSHMLYANVQSGQGQGNVQSQAKIELIKNLLGLKNEIQEVTEVMAKIFPEKKNYAEFMARASQEEIEDLAGKLESSGFLGSQEFIATVRTQMQKKGQDEEQQPQAQPQKLILKPVIIFSFTVLLAGVVAGTIYITKNIAMKAKGIAVAQKKGLAPGAKETPAQTALFELEGTEWVIELRPGQNTGTGYPPFDKIAFKSGALSSNYFSSRGFTNSNYALTVKKDGALIWETMQRDINGNRVFWRGEVKDQKMRGAFTRQPVNGESTDVSFSSGNYRRLE